MKHPVALTILILATACSRPGQTTAELPEREAIEILYVSAPRLEIHKSPEAASPVIAVFNSGEAVSVLSKKGDWLEIRVNDGSGWSQSSDLAASAEETRSTATAPKFLTPPAPVSNSTLVHGEIVLEGSVNESGEITSIRTLSNTTGSADLERLNKEQFARARFYPMMKNGAVIPFVYMYRIEY